MDNYHYIISSLPVLSPDYKFTVETPESLLDGILEQLSESDRALVEFLERGFRRENLNAEFYREALSHRNRFIRSFFAFDLNLRNAKVEYLNKALDRPEGKDIIDPNSDEDLPRVETMEFEEASKAEAILYGDDLLARERGLDELVWEKADALTTFDYFDIEAVLGFLSKLNIVSRWFLLDEETGRAFFKKLVEEVRGTFKGVEYNEQ